MDETANTTSAGWKWELAALAAAMMGVAARCLPWRFVFRQDGVFFPGVDPYYHLWRAHQLAHTFPNWSLWDPFLRHPLGAPSPYLVGFDSLLALPALLGFGQESIEPWAALLAPLLGGLAVYLVYRLGRAIFSPAVGLAAAILYAFMPGAINYTIVGRADHHALVAPLVLGIFLCLLKTLDCRRRNRLVFWCGLGGVLAGWLVSSLPITPPLYFLPVVLTLVILGWERRREIRPAVLGFTVAAALAVTAAVWLTGDLARWPWELFLPSLVSLVLFWLGAAWATASTFGTAWSLGVLALVAGGLVAGWLGHFSWSEPLRRILEVAGGDSSAFAGIVESESLLRVGGIFTVNRAVAFYSNLVLLVPVAWVVLAQRGARRGAAPGTLLAVIYSGLGMTLLLLQQRFGDFAAPSLALLLAWALVKGGRVVSVYRLGAASRIRATFLAAGLALAVLAALWPLVAGLVRFSRTDTVRRSRQLVHFGEKLAATIPEPVGDEDQPSYGLLSSEEDGVVLLYSAHRPLVVASFGMDEIQRHNGLGYRVFFASDETEAAVMLDRLGVGYLVVSPILNRVEAMTKVAGLDVVMVSGYRDLVENRVVQKFEPLPALVQALHTRLLVLDGSAGKIWGQQVRAVGRFRLHLESGPRPDSLYPLGVYFKAFEYVRGARLLGTAPAASEVLLRLTVRTNTGRAFTYRATSRSDEQGRFEFLVPYATEGSRSPCRAVSPYRIKAGEAVYRVQVPEVAVKQGLEVAVNRKDDTMPAGGQD